MTIRWKLFLILLVFSLVPLGVVTLISQRGTSRMSNAISEDVGQNLTRIADGVLKLTAEKSGEILAKNSTAVAFALMWLTREAESALAAGAPVASKIYFVHDLDETQTAPPDFGPHPDYRRRSAEGRLVPHGVSFTHPVFLLAPGVSATQVSGDAARLSGLTNAFQEIARGLGKTLHWAYISLKDGLHVSYPGHGGYPEGYDPRTRAWYQTATGDVAWTLPMVDATTGQVVMTASKRVRRPDGTVAGVAAMDETGGDYYDFLKIREDTPGRAGIVVGDVSGRHSVRAADGLGPGLPAPAPVASRQPLRNRRGCEPPVLPGCEGIRRVHDTVLSGRRFNTASPALGARGPRPGYFFRPRHGNLRRTFRQGVPAGGR
jgi:hypothetical protein